MDHHFLKIILLLLATNLIVESLVLKSSDVSFSSQALETHLVIKVDSSLSSTGGAVLSVTLNGSGAPQDVKVEEVLSVNGGTIQVAAGEAPLASTTNSADISDARSKIPSILLISGFSGLVFGSRRNPLILVSSLALLMGGAFALTSLNPSWILTVTISVPPNYQFNSLNVDIAQGSFQSDLNAGVMVSKLKVDLCKNTGNTVFLDGFTFSQSAAVCSSDLLRLNSITVSDKATLNATSTKDSAHVFIKNTYAGAFSLASENGYAFHSLCSDATLSTYTTKSLIGQCGSIKSGITLAAHFDAILSLAEDTSLKGALRWSDASTWGGKIPTKGSNVVIEAGKIILLDTTTASLGSLEIKGSLIADPTSDFWLTADSIVNSGTLRVGWLSAPYTKKGRFTLTGAQGVNITREAPLLGWTNDGVSRGFRSTNGSVLELHGSPPRAVYTRLNANAKQNDTVLTVDSVEGWNVGDQITISPTTFPSTSSSDDRIIKSIDAVNNRVTIDKGLSYARWGRIQYMTDKGISFTPGVFDKYRAHPDTPDVLDERAVIVHLTRNIVIEAPNDTNWNEKGHGVHVQWMGVKSRIQLNGVEVRRAGQAGILGRYPIHAHMQSYNLPNGVLGLSDGVFLGDAKDTFVRNCAVHQSVQRAYVIHGSCGTRWVNNVANDIQAHAYFIEDGSEIRNHIIGNVALNIRPPKRENYILYHDENAGGIWVTNPNNHIRDNIFGDVRNGPGLWNSFADGPYEIAKFINIQTPSGVTFTPDLFRYGGATPVPFELWTLTATNETHWKVEGSINGAQPMAIKDKAYPDVNRDNTPGIVNFMISGSNAVAGSKITFSIDKYKGGCLGQSRYVRLYPINTPVLDYYNNTAFSCSMMGGQTEARARDDTGAFNYGGFHTSINSMPDNTYDPVTRYSTIFHTHKFWMNEGSAYWSRLEQPHYIGWLLADNGGTDLNGAVQYGSLAANMLFVGQSLNDLEPKITNRESAKHGLATYHFTMIFQNMTFFNFAPAPANVPWSYGQRASIDVPGVLESYELYTSPVELGPIEKISNWRYFNVTQSERTVPPNLEYLYQNNPNYNMTGWNGGGPEAYDRRWTLSGAVYDHQGFFAGKDGEYIIFDIPFLTYNLSTYRRVGRNISFTLATPDKFGGIRITAASDENPYIHTEPETYERLDKNWGVIGKWAIDNGRDSNGRIKMLGNMRHASVQLNGARYRIYNHETGKLYSVRTELQIANAAGPKDDFMVSIPWDTSLVPSPKVSVYPAANITQTFSKNQMASTATSYWIGTNEIWYHHSGVIGQYSWGLAGFVVEP